MAHLTMALGMEVLLIKVNKVSTTKWPGGVASELIDLLKEEYQPNDQVATVERKRRLSAIKMNKWDKSAKLFEQFVAIENQFSGMAKVLDVKDQIAVVLEMAPKECASMLANTEREHVSQLTLEQLEEAMTIQFRIPYRESDEYGSTTAKLMLTAFQGSCYLCKEKGHRADQCTNKGKEEQGKFKGKYHHCGKMGHKLASYWTKESNADKRSQ
eukprot:6381906-Ditylum_brightwellii.AAC.1